MPTYTVINRATGIEVIRYAAMAPVQKIDALAVPFAEFDHTPLPEDAEPVQPVVSMTWTKLEYLRRFTQAERVAIRPTCTSETTERDA